MIPRQSNSIVVATLIISLAHGVAVAKDKIEFLSGSTITGTVKEIRKVDKEFDFETTIGDRTFTRTYPFNKVHAVTWKGKRHKLNPKADPNASPANSTNEPITQTKADVEAMIETAGTTTPDWFDSTPLDYPETLDLTWPLKPAYEGWNIQKNMVHYLYSAIQENPSRYHSGVKLVHHCMSLHKSDETLLQRDMKKLGTMYFELLKDYPRAAFWLQKANVRVTRTEGIHLASRDQ